MHPSRRSASFLVLACLGLLNSACGDGPRPSPCPSDRGTPDYLATAVDLERFFRWTGVSGFDHIPLFVEVEDRSLVDRDRHVDDVVAARETWKALLKSSGVRIESYTRFLSTSPPFSTSSGVIRIHFVEQLPGKLGQVQRVERAGRIASMEMTLAMRDDAGRTLGSAQSRAAALHEFGHALGIVGFIDGTSHSSEVADVMYTNDQCHWSSLAGGDQAAIRRLYSLAPQVVRVDG